MTTILDGNPIKTNEYILACMNATADLLFKEFSEAAAAQDISITEWDSPVDEIKAAVSAALSNSRVAEKMVVSIIHGGLRSNTPVEEVAGTIAEIIGYSCTVGFVLQRSDRSRSLAESEKSGRPVARLLTGRWHFFPIGTSIDAAKDTVTKLAEGIENPETLPVPSLEDALKAEVFTPVSVEAYMYAKAITESAEQFSGKDSTELLELLTNGEKLELPDGMSIEEMAAGIGERYAEMRGAVDMAVIRGLHELFTKVNDVPTGVVMMMLDHWMSWTIKIGLAVKLAFLVRQGALQHPGESLELTPLSITQAVKREVEMVLRTTENQVVGAFDSVHGGNDGGMGPLWRVYNLSTALKLLEIPGESAAYQFSDDGTFDQVRDSILGACQNAWDRSQTQVVSYAANSDELADKFLGSILGFFTLSAAVTDPTTYVFDHDAQGFHEGWQTFLEMYSVRSSEWVESEAFMAEKELAFMHSVADILGAVGEEDDEDE